MPALCRTLNLLPSTISSFGLFDWGNFAERLDESSYLVPKITIDDPIQEYSAEAVANSSMPNMSIPVSSNTEASIRMQSNALYVPKSSGLSVISSSSAAQTPRSSHASHKSPSNALAGARFFIDPDLPRDLRAKVIL